MRTPAGMAAQQAAAAAPWASQSDRARTSPPTPKAATWGRRTASQAGLRPPTGDTSFVEDVSKVPTAQMATPTPAAARTRAAPTRAARATRSGAPGGRGGSMPSRAAAPPSAKAAARAAPFQATPAAAADAPPPAPPWKKVMYPPPPPTAPAGAAAAAAVPAKGHQTCQMAAWAAAAARPAAARRPRPVMQARRPVGEAAREAHAKDAARVCSPAVHHRITSRPAQPWPATREATMASAAAAATDTQAAAAAVMRRDEAAGGGGAPEGVATVVALGVPSRPGPAPSASPRPSAGVIPPGAGAAGVPPGRALGRAEPAAPMRSRFPATAAKFPAFLGGEGNLPGAAWREGPGARCASGGAGAGVPPGGARRGMTG